jgi:hypothetical protein
MKTKRKKNISTKKYNTKKYNTKKYNTKKYNTKKYKKAKGIKEAKCAKIMGKCFREECFECFELLNNEDNPNPVFNKQYKIPEKDNLFIPDKILKRDNLLTKPTLNRQKRFYLSNTVDAMAGKELALKLFKKD